ncbi:MAG: hypothetical protein LBG05_07445 [Treponema sp.]|jgi:hypothetical protein|nr:hypothetical protein [Treponema sp.]
MNSLIFLKPFALLFVLLSLGSCRQKEAESLIREDLFSLGIGRLEDEIAFYNQEEDRGRSKGDVCMRDGIFYISDSDGQKIVRCNSYGNILSMIYNDETNPIPLTLKPKEDGKAVTRWTFTYPLQKPGRITVDSRKHIYVEDRLPDERHTTDSESKAVLDSVVLHFNDEGRFLEYLGQEGLGGSPFPRIEGLFTSMDDDLAVVCHLPTGWNVYWFDAEGTLLYLVKIKNDSAPIPADRKELVFASLDGITAAPDARRLYIKIDYYRATFDESTKTRTGSEIDSSVIWAMRVEDGSYEKTIEAPLYEMSWTEVNRKIVVRIPYSLMGAAKNESVFLSFPEETGYALAILDTRDSYGRQIQTSVNINADELQFNVFDISTDGILSAMLVSDWIVKFVWWRTDNLLIDKNK